MRRNYERNDATKKAFNSISTSSVDNYTCVFLCVVFFLCVRVFLLMNSEERS